MPTYGCDKQNTVGSFVNGILGWFRRGVESVKSFFLGKTFDCPNPLCGKPIPSGQGIETCPHCGMTKEQAGNKCD